MSHQKENQFISSLLESNDRQKGQNYYQNFIYSQSQSSFHLKRSDPKSIILNSFNYEQQQQGSQQSQHQLDQHKPQGLTRAEKKRQCSKQYRNRQKQRVKHLQEQNAYLKHKVNDLSFRLKQKQMQINKLKNHNQPHTLNFSSLKDKYIKQIEELLQKEEKDQERMKIVGQQFKNLLTYGSNTRMEVLNYHMSQLLQNVIDDRTFYFIDSALNKTGFWCDNQNQNVRLIDQQITDLLGTENVEKKKAIKRQFAVFVMDIIKNFKTQWKRLYESYLELIKQGLLLESYTKPIQQKMKKYVQISSFLKLNLHFEKIKYRKDFRQLRQSWFRQFQDQQFHKKDQHNYLKSAEKRSKLDILSKS